MLYPPEKVIRSSFAIGSSLAIILAAVITLEMAGAPAPRHAQNTPAIAATNAPVAPTMPSITQPQSIFINQIGQGKDPFFPDSTRRLRPDQAPKATPSPVFDQLALKGITGTKSRRFAIINTEVFAVGESHELILAGQRVVVRCDQINENSVLVSIVGQPITKELKLRQF